MPRHKVKRVSDNHSVAERRCSRGRQDRAVWKQELCLFRAFDGSSATILMVFSHLLPVVGHIKLFLVGATLLKVSNSCNFLDPFTQLIRIKLLYFDYTMVNSKIS